MSKLRFLTIALSVAFLSTLVSSTARADSVNLPSGLVKLNLVDSQTLSLPDTEKVDLTGLLAEHFANNSGRHIGFSVAAFHGGLKFGLANPNTSSPTVTQNPEPTGMLLLGTGLAAGAAFARRRVRRRRDQH
jgi:hypothetical protein